MIQCTMNPTQFSLAELFQQFAQQASELKLVALNLLAQARQALYDGSKDLYNQLMVAYESALGVYDTFVDNIQAIFDVISPLPLSSEGSIYSTITSYQKEWTTKAKAIVSDYTMYLPQKFLELITSVLPVSLEVPIPVIGNVDIIQFFNDPAYRSSIKAQIADALSAFSDAITGMYTGLFGGVVSGQMSLHEVWLWVCQQISTGGMTLLFEAFKALIKEFKSVWDSLGLPALPDLITLDIEGLILTAITTVKNSYESLINSAKNTYDEVLSLFSEGNADKGMLEAARENLMSLVSEQWGAVIAALSGLSIFGIPLGSLLTISYSTTTVSSEDIIADLISQAKDFVNNYVLNIFISWMDTVKSFFNAIGLGAIVDFITFNFCDFLDLIGFNMP